MLTIDYGLPYPISSACPHDLADRSANVVVLKPNPNYGGTRARKLDAIVYHMGIGAAAAADQVLHGSLDYVQGADPALETATVAARGAGYRLVPDDNTVTLALNSRRAAFASLDARRAVAYAIDRRALATATGSFTAPASSFSRRACSAVRSRRRSR